MRIEVQMFETMCVCQTFLKSNQNTLSKVKLVLLASFNNTIQNEWKVNILPSFSHNLCEITGLEAVLYVLCIRDHVADLLLLRQTTNNLIFLAPCHCEV